VKLRALVTCLVAVALLPTAVAPAAGEEGPTPRVDVPVFFQVIALLSQQAPIRPSFTIDPPGPDKLVIGTSEGAVVLAVMRGNRKSRVAVTEYVARGVQTRERLKATFGRFGHISMRFRESPHRPWFGKPRNCRGRDRFVVRRGVFVGSLRFRGEGGYLKVDLHRAKAKIADLAAKCRHHRHRPRGARPSSLSEDTVSGLFASDRNGVNATTFAAFSLRDELFFLGQHEESRGRISVVRSAIVIGHGGLALNEEVTAGNFSPGTPFHGVGRYRAAPDGSTTWSGNLSANFPGAPRFPLTGPNYETTLEAGL